MRALLALLLLTTLAHAAPDPLVIHTDKGRVAGAPTADGKVIAYKGIPYAAPPIEELRWKAPTPAAKWKKVLPAYEYGAHCVQFGSWPDMVFHDPGESEDCLTLNVWTPAGAPQRAMKKGSTLLPVMVWIYGGGFVTGSTSENRQDGQFLAHRDVVVVSMNYRLGLFGFLALPGLSAESGHNASGNYGLMDQAAALRWVRDNIESFGGDPSNVTLFGESAGAFSVSAQMASPLGRGLFSKAIGQSGGAFFSPSLSFPPREQSEAAAAKWADRVFGSSSPFVLRQASIDDLRKAMTARPTGPPVPAFLPDIDGYFLTDSVPGLYAAGQQAHIPLLAGWNADESHTNHPATAEAFAAQARSDFGPDAPKLLALYPGTTDAEVARAANDYSGDNFIAYSSWRWIEAHTESGNAPVFRYFFDLPSPGDRNHPASAGAFHSDDIEYVFGALDSRPGMKQRPEDARLSELMQVYWTNFAKTGDPNGPGLPKWPTYNGPGNWQVMHLDATPGARPDTLRNRYLFLDSVWGR